MQLALSANRKIPGAMLHSAPLNTVQFSVLHLWCKLAPCRRRGTPNFAVLAKYSDNEVIQSEFRLPSKFSLPFTNVSCGLSIRRDKTKEFRKNVPSKHARLQDKRRGQISVQRDISVSLPPSASLIKPMRSHSMTSHSTSHNEGKNVEPIPLRFSRMKRKRILFFFFKKRFLYCCCSRGAGLRPPWETAVKEQQEREDGDRSKSLKEQGERGISGVGSLLCAERAIVW